MMVETIQIIIVCSVVTLIIVSAIISYQLESVQLNLKRVKRKLLEHGESATQCGMGPCDNPKCKPCTAASLYPMIDKLIHIVKEADL